MRRPGLDQTDFDAPPLEWSVGQDGGYGEPDWRFRLVHRLPFTIRRERASADFRAADRAVGELVDLAVRQLLRVSPSATPAPRCLGKRIRVVAQAIQPARRLQAPAAVQ